MGGALRDLHVFQNEEKEHKKNPSGITCYQNENENPDAGKMKFDADANAIVIMIY